MSSISYKTVIFLSILLYIFSIGLSFSQSDNFYDIQKIQVIKLYFDYSNWDYRLDSAKAGKEDYILAKSCLINGIHYDSVGVKYKGNSSYRNTQVKNPLHIKLDWINNSQDYQKYTSIKLGNNFSDPSGVREALSYSILSNYMDCSSANFSLLYINDVYIGLYTNVEAVNKKFCSDHYGSSDHVFVKGNPDKPGANSTSNLVFNGYDSSKYYIYYGMENGIGWYKLIALMDSLKNNSKNLSKILDIDRTIWMHAYNSVFSNYDSYTGSFAQNYYLYEDDFGRFLPVIWDLNMSIGGFPGGVGGAGGTTTDKIPFFTGETNVARPLIQKILEHPQQRRMYTAHIRTLCSEFINNKEYEVEAKKLQTVIDSFIKTDPNSLTTYASYLTSLTAPISSGGGPGGGTPGISTLMNARLNYFKTVGEFTALPPTITNIKWDKPNPKVGDTLWINIQLTNGNTTFLGYRKNKSYPFTKQTLFDDGMHHDVLANDGIYGNSMIASSRKTQYYIYGENNLAGIFSPMRAEYEYYNLEATEIFSAINKSDVVINELMSSNKTTVLDTSDDKFEDWLELYNNTDQNIDLSGIYLSDDFTKKDKWEFPKGSIISSKNRIVLWLDEDKSTQNNLHANFKLSASGEELILSRPDGLILDSLSFNLIAADNSLERCPDGTGTFKISSKSSYNDVNCITTNNIDRAEDLTIELYPNPAHDEIQLNLNKVLTGRILIYDTQGRFQKSITFSSENKIDISLYDLSPGFYMLYVQNLDGKSFIKKMIIQ
ncbi:MAG: CotH kinase family protein [Saprospiraceae bacterium]